MVKELYKLGQGQRDRRVEQGAKRQKCSVEKVEADASGWVEEADVSGRVEEADMSSPV